MNTTRGLITDFINPAEEEVIMPKDGDKQEELIIKGIDRWLDKKFAEFGRWSLRAVLALGFGVLVYMALTQKGWTPPTH